MGPCQRQGIGAEEAVNEVDEVNVGACDATEHHETDMENWDAGLEDEACELDEGGDDEAEPGLEDQSWADQFVDDNVGEDGQEDVPREPCEEHEEVDEHEETFLEEDAANDALRTPAVVSDGRFAKERTKRHIFCDNSKCQRLCQGNAVGQFLCHESMPSPVEREAAWRDTKWDATWYCSQ